MRGSRNDGFMQRKSVNTDIQEAADHDSKYEDYDVRNRIEEKKHREFLSGVYGSKNYLLSEYVLKSFGAYSAVTLPSASIVIVAVGAADHFADFLVSFA